MRRTQTAPGTPPSIFAKTQAAGAYYLKVLFENMIAPDSPFLAIIAHAAVQAATGTIAAFVQGFPGAGKTFLGVLFAIWYALDIGENLLWTAQGNSALEEAAKIHEALLKDADETIL